MSKTALGLFSRIFSMILRAVKLGLEEHESRGIYSSILTLYRNNFH